MVLFGSVQGRIPAKNPLRKINKVTDTAEREGAIRMIQRNKAGLKRWTLGADTKGFVSDCRELGVTPHVARGMRMETAVRRSMAGRLDARFMRRARNAVVESRKLLAG